MAVLNNNQLGGASGQAGGYFLEDSLRFRSSASAYLNRTASSAPTNGKKLTLSCWVKRGATGTRVYLAQSGVGTGNDNYSSFYFNANNTIQISMYSVVPRVTTQVFRDPSAWYHFVVAYDTTQASADNRVKLYVNGEQVTSFTTNGTIPTDTLIAFTKQSQAMYIGTASDEATYFDGYITEYNLIDGQQLAPTSFGEYNKDTGVWQPKKYNGSYGTNGFYLKGRGTDNSGNGNNFTENNIDTSSGDATYDLMSDVPTLTDEDTNNFATLNPNNMAVNTTMTDGNLKASNSVNHATMFPTIIPTTGKYYFELTMPVHAAVGGIGFRTDTNKVESAYSDEANKYYFYLNNSNAYRIVETTNTALGANLNNTTSTFQVAIDFDAAKYYFGRDNTWYAADWGTDGDPASGTNPSYDLTDGTKMFPFVYVAGGTWTVNFGQQPFNYTPPTGFKKINAYNLPDSTIVDGSQHFDIQLWTGNDANPRSFSNTAFSPDFVWYKARNNAYYHNLYDSVRGATRTIYSNATSAEYVNDVSGTLKSFDSDGFTVGGDSDVTTVNQSGGTYVGWQWRGSDSTAASNTDGSITSTVSANTTAGFSVVRYSGNATSGATVGHGLGVAPEIVIGKTLDTGGYDWPVYVTALGDTSKTLTLNLTAAAGTETNKYNGTAPSATVVTLGNHGTNLSGTNNQILYCFAPVEGYSKFGSYYGNGSADGTFVYTGFRPAFVMFKNASDTRQWGIVDTARSTYNQTNATLEPSTSNAENTSDDFDIFANGFRPVTTDPGSNGSGNTIIYMAFAENPFKNSNAR